MGQRERANQSHCDRALFTSKNSRYDLFNPIKPTPIESTMEGLRLSRNAGYIERYAEE